MGTPEFALPSLNKLAQVHRILCVVSRPDRPKGRGMKVLPTPVKFFATQLGIPVVQPQKIVDIIESLKSMQPEIIVVVAYGEILPAGVLEIPSRGCINLHPSLLPELRGPEPIAWSIILGREKTGITTMWMNEEIDAGDIILQMEMEILPRDTRGSLEKRMSVAGAELLYETLKLIEEGNAPRKKQMGEPTFAPVIKKADCLIDWSRTATEIHNLVRGLNPSPSAYTFLEGRRFKIHSSRTFTGSFSGRPGEIVEVKESEIFVATGNGVLSILEIQPEGKRAMSVKDFLLGHSVKKGMRFE